MVKTSSEKKPDKNKQKSILEVGYLHITTAFPPIDVMFHFCLSNWDGVNIKQQSLQFKTTHKHLI